eukprot:900118-Prymnesium_polylepis.1
MRDALTDVWLKPPGVVRHAIEEKIRRRAIYDTILHTTDIPHHLQSPTVPSAPLPPPLRSSPPPATCPSTRPSSAAARHLRHCPACLPSSPALPAPASSAA